MKRSDRNTVKDINVGEEDALLEGVLYILIFLFEGSIITKEIIFSIFQTIVQWYLTNEECMM